MLARLVASLRDRLAGASSVAGIVDDRGGTRIVVTQRWRMRFHVGPGERLFVLPGISVQEPVAWGAIPDLIGRVTAYVEQHK